MRVSQLDKIDKSQLPLHIAIIMDGNGRWAQEKGEDRLFGHYHGVESVRNIVEGCAELGIEYLTLYAFRSEEHTSELQSRENLVCRLLLEKKKKKRKY